MRILFAIHAQNRGPLSQAITVKQILERSGHELVGVIITQAKSNHTTPEFFKEHFQKVALQRHESFQYHYHKNGWFRPIRTFLDVLSKIPRTLKRVIPGIDRFVRKTEPDLIINFSDPWIGVWKWWRQSRTPIVSLGVIFSYLHPSFHVPYRNQWQRLFYVSLAKIAGLGSYARIGLALKHLDHWKNRSLYILPPLIRDEIRSMDREKKNGLVVYFGDHLSFKNFTDNSKWIETAEKKWKEEVNRPFKINCFSSHHDPIDRLDVSIARYPRDSKEFLEKFEQCSGLITHGGFDIISEAMVLGKPVGMVPNPGDYSQCVTAFIAQWNGAGVILNDLLEIDRFLPYMKRYRPNPSFIEWVDRGEKELLQIISSVYRESRTANEWTRRTAKPVATVKVPILVREDEFT